MAPLAALGHPQLPLACLGSRQQSLPSSLPPLPLLRSCVEEHLAMVPLLEEALGEADYSSMRQATGEVVPATEEDKNGGVLEGIPVSLLVSSRMDQRS